MNNTDISSLIRIYLKLYGLFLLKSFSNYVWLKFTAFIIFIFLNLLYKLFIGSTDSYSWYQSVEPLCLVVGIYMAADTQYSVEDYETRIWSKKFGFKLEEKEE